MVIATYDYSAVLRHSLRSALRQTYRNLEVLVVGDGCTDDSERVVAEAGDPRASWTNLPVNSGSQSAPNMAGIAAARGELVAYLGHDDLWTPNHLALLVRAMRRQKADMAHSALLALGPPETNMRTIHGLRPFADGPREWIAPSALLHRTALAHEVGGWRDYRTLERPPDTDFVTRLARSGARCASVPALTVFKLNSTLRPNCYVDKPSHEQAALAARMARPAFVERELARTWWVNATRSPRLPAGFPEVPDAPQPMPLGWEVTQYRRIRGLE